MALVTLLQIVLSVLCVLVALALLVRIIRDVTPGNAELLALGLIELGLVAHLVLGLLRLGDPHQGVSVATWIGYLVGLLLLIPVGVVWSSSERSRSGTTVLVIAVLLVPVLFLRLTDIWTLSA